MTGQTRADGCAAADLERYAAWAGAALEHFDVPFDHVEFLGHNSGVAFRVRAEVGAPDLFLKLHTPRGSSEPMDPAHVAAGMIWLRDLANMDPGFPVPAPVPDREGRLLSEVRVPDLPSPVGCSLQLWVEGECAASDWTEEQAVAIGAMTARLHDCGSRWMPPRPIAGLVLGPDWFANRLGELTSAGKALGLEVEELQLLGRAGELVIERLDDSSVAPKEWGPLHGDLHQENVVFFEGQPRPIDFACLTLGPYAWDLGVLAYFTMYLPAAVRRSLVASYTSWRGRAVLANLALETFLVGFAIDNLAFQVSIPEQRTSGLFRRNMHQLIDEYCRALLRGDPFVLS